MSKWAVFCEAPGDFDTLSGLIERVLVGAVPWLAGQALPGGFWKWHPSSVGAPLWDLHRYKGFAQDLDLRLHHGHFNGQPGEAGSLMAYTLCQIARKWNQRGHAITALVVVWDADNQPAARTAGLKQGFDEASVFWKDGLVWALAQPEREGWVLAGFVPQSPAEQALLDAERQMLGFYPNVEPERLSAQRDAKVVLAALTRGSSAREVQCWTQTALATLRQNGVGCGLTDFLDQVCRVLAKELNPGAQCP